MRPTSAAAAAAMLSFCIPSGDEWRKVLPRKCCIFKACECFGGRLHVGGDAGCRAAGDVPTLPETLSGTSFGSAVSSIHDTITINSGRTILTKTCLIQEYGAKTSVFRLTQSAWSHELILQCSHDGSVGDGKVAGCIVLVCHAEIFHGHSAFRRTRPRYSHVGAGYMPRLVDCNLERKR